MNNKMDIRNAVINGDVQYVEKYIDTIGYTVTGNSLLHLYLKYQRNDNMIPLLLSRQDINCLDSNNETPINFSTRFKWKPKTILTLLAHGADPCIADKNGNTMLHNLLRTKRDYDYDFLKLFDYMKDIKNNKGYCPYDLIPK